MLTCGKKNSSSNINISADLLLSTKMTEELDIETSFTADEVSDLAHDEEIANSFALDNSV